MELGPVAIAAVAVAVLVVVGLLAFLLRSRLSPRGRDRAHVRSEFLNEPRTEVLETTVIDDERKLVLVRCDDIEHLIMIGGPADVVVENDVKKVRPPALAQQPAKPQASAPLASPPVPAGPTRLPPAAAATLDAAIAAVAPKPPEPARVPPRQTLEPRAPVQAPRPGLATVQPAPPRPAGRNGEAPTLQPKPEDRAAARREVAAEMGRRELTVSPRRQPQAPLPQPAARPAETGRGNGVGSDQGGARGNGRAPDAGLPAATVPWAEPNSIENEIVQALRIDPLPRAPESARDRREPSIPKPAIESSATLGDLADRLEEALAREMQSVKPARKAEPAASDVSRNGDARNETRSSEPERPKRQTVRERQPERRERVEPSTRAAGPEGEQRRDQPSERRESAERREEAPVISLNARRREAADPLEDEMARLLGELTGDSKSR